VTNAILSQATVTRLWGVDGWGGGERGDFGNKWGRGCQGQLRQRVRTKKRGLFFRI